MGATQKPRHALERSSALESRRAAPRCCSASTSAAQSAFFRCCASTFACKKHAGSFGSYVCVHDRITGLTVYGKASGSWSFKHGAGEQERLADSVRHRKGGCRGNEVFVARTWPQKLQP